MERPRITAFDWVPPFAEGQVRDLRVRWALEEVGQPYDVTYLSQGSQKHPEPVSYTHLTLPTILLV